MQRRETNSPPTAWNRFHLDLPPHPFANDLLPASPFGINMAMGPGGADNEARLRLMQQAGMKWGRQTFSWPQIEREKGRYDLDPYAAHVQMCRKYGMHLFGDLTSSPTFHDPRTPEGVEAYCAFARAAVKRFQGEVDHWQIWNEPNGGFWRGSPEEYARLLVAVSRAIRETNPQAKVLAFNMAFCDVRWAERILKQIPYDSFDILCYHPYRLPSTPEEHFDWWVLDQYVGNWHREELSENDPMVHQSFLEQTEELVRVVERYGKRKPFWITEVGWNTPICPFGSHEMHSANMFVRFYLLALASRRIEKVFPWTLRDGRPWQFDNASMVGMMRTDLAPKYSYCAYAVMTRMIEGKAWVRNEHFGPDVYAVVFQDSASGEETMAAWTTRPYAYIRVANRSGLVFHDIFGTRRQVPLDAKRTANVIVPLSDGVTYIVGPPGLKSELRDNPGDHWI